MLIYTLPVIASLIGWFTNYLAIKMLFHPRRPVNFFLFKLQGVFPKRQKAFAEKLGVLVSQELLSSSDFKSMVSKGLKADKLREMLDESVTKLITEKLPEKLPMLQMIINPELISMLKTLIFDELDAKLEGLVGNVGASITDNLDIMGTVKEKVENFSSDKLEEIVLSIMKKELKFVELIGALLGFVIGLIQVALIQISS